MKIAAPPTLTSPQDRQIYTQRLEKFTSDWEIRRLQRKAVRSSVNPISEPAQSRIDTDFLERANEQLLPSFDPLPKLANARDFKAALAMANGRRARAGVLTYAQVQLLGLSRAQSLLGDDLPGSQAIYLMALPEWRTKLLPVVTAVLLVRLPDETIFGHAEALQRGHLFLSGERIQKISSDELRLFFPFTFARYTAAARSSAGPSLFPSPSPI